MISDKLVKAFNEQINAELYSAYLYLAMSAYLETEDYNGFANWMMIQFQEEQAHAMKMYNYLLERGAKVKLTQIAEPPEKWDGPAAVFEATLEHERVVTKRINDLVWLACDERDKAAEIFLQWFVSEQVEEESSVETLLGQFKIAQSSPQALLMLDRELSARKFIPPAAE